MAAAVFIVPPDPDLPRHPAAPCLTCGSRLIIVDGSAARSMALLQDEIPPLVFQRLAARLWELAERQGSAHLEIHLHVARGLVVETRLDFDEAIMRVRAAVIR